QGSAKFFLTLIHMHARKNNIAATHYWQLILLKLQSKTFMQQDIEDRKNEIISKVLNARVEIITNLRNRCFGFATQCITREQIYHPNMGEGRNTFGNLLYKKV
ncbi:hypothetical protein ACJX0J_015904, partial [Zea mays]